MILSQSEGLGKMALGIVKIYLGSHFLANRRCLRQFIRGQFVTVSCRGPEILLGWPSHMRLFFTSPVCFTLCCKMAMSKILHFFRCIFLKSHSLLYFLQKNF